MDADRSTAMPGPFAGAVFDVDGVLVDSPHERAWREALQAMMRGPWSDIRERTSWTPEAFTPQVYQQVVSGRPRMSGARAVLELFQVPDAGTRAAEYAECKQAMILELIEAGRFDAFPDALRFVLAVRVLRVRIPDRSHFQRANWLMYEPAEPRSQTPERQL
jgi:beta-phosphoglucomutase-like phosphatase (HAD superfamily)